VWSFVAALDTKFLYVLSTINAASPFIPTIVKSYHKKNTGPFVETPFGPRQLRQGEIERIHGAKAFTEHYATAVEVLGTGRSASGLPLHLRPVGGSSGRWGERGSILVLGRWRAKDVSVLG
jgi:hypothetical protein